MQNISDGDEQFNCIMHSCGNLIKQLLVRIILRIKTYCYRSNNNKYVIRIVTMVMMSKIRWRRFIRAWMCAWSRKYHVIYVFAFKIDLLIFVQRISYVHTHNTHTNHQHLGYAKYRLSIRFFFFCFLQWTPLFTFKRMHFDSNQNVNRQQTMVRFNWGQLQFLRAIKILCTDTR